MQDKVNIDLFRFVKVGKFGGLKIGMGREEVLELFSDPDDFSVPDENQGDMMSAKIWLYGAFELHFENDQLWLIFCDHLDSWLLYPPSKDTKLNFYTWIFTKKKKYSLRKIINLLISEEIAFSLSYGDLHTINLNIEESQVNFGFYNDNYEDFEKIDWKKWKLFNLSLMDKSILEKVQA